MQSANSRAQRSATGKQIWLALAINDISMIPTPFPSPLPSPPPLHFSKPSRRAAIRLTASRRTASRRVAFRRAARRLTKTTGESVDKSAGKSADKKAGRTLNADDTDDPPLVTSIVWHKAKGPPPPVHQVSVHVREPVQKPRTTGRKRGRVSTKNVQR